MSEYDRSNPFLTHLYEFDYSKRIPFNRGANLVRSPKNFRLYLLSFLDRPDVQMAVNRENCLHTFHQPLKGMLKDGYVKMTTGNKYSRMRSYSYLVITITKKGKAYLKNNKKSLNKLMLDNTV